MQRSEGNRCGCRAPGLLACLVSCGSKYIDKVYWTLIVIYISFRAKVDIQQKVYVVEIYGLYNLRKEKSSLP